MKTRLLSRLAVIGLILIAFTSCNKSNKSFKLTGTLEGITDGEIIMMSAESKDLPADTAKIENGQFVFTGDIPEPAQYYLLLEEKQQMVMFYAENADMTLTANADSLSKAVISGGKTQDDNNMLQQRVRELSNKYQLDKLYQELYPKKGQDPVSKERANEINALMDKFSEESNQLSIDFIKENPKSYLSAILIGQVTSGKSAADIEKYVKLLDPEIAATSRVKKMLENLGQMKQTEVSLDSFIKDAHNLSYAVEPGFAGKQHMEVIYLAVMSDNNICALKSDGSVCIINPKGATVKEFKSNLKSKSGAIAVDKSDNIYVLGTMMGKKKVESRGRTVEVDAPVGAECVVFDSKGARLRDIKLDGLLSVTGVRVSDNNLLLVADTRGRLIAIFDAQTGKKNSSIEKLRTCCGILDFSIRNNNEILVANLGAFRVEGFDFTGKQLLSFGQRGNDINDFHGCCNPVSVAYLSNGGIVTVEKDPTRIKVYSHEGAKKVEGIEELVKGCAYIPMTVDKNDNVYLASKTGGIIKCVASK